MACFRKVVVGETVKRGSVRVAMQTTLGDQRDVINTMVTIRNDYTGKLGHELHESALGAGIALAPCWRVIRFQSLNR